ncbi:signal peptidase II [Paragemmobacter straminiformis]|uniref:Lipoprotein signal peptidase n=1 Tax=Paragemmobacter straminiformis TaxID=2045119 RepID=A0A842IAN9_9RHOB|nr:signal peptidase II [Gemmobacter straminiformis]MBC2836174.1 signal peptidase II [Gemmobacter straminiformis]
MRLAAWVTGAVFALDQVTKVLVVQVLGLIDRGGIDVLPPFLVFRMAWNRGINFGLFAGDAEVMRWILIAVALAVSVWVWLWVRREGAGRWQQISAGLLIGGALGNVVDRVIYGAVADFLNMSCCGIENPYAFNVADVAIFAGALGLVLFSGQDKTDKAKKRAALRSKLRK